MDILVSENCYQLEVLNNTVICKVNKRISVKEFSHMIDHVLEIAKTSSASKMLIDFSKVDFSDLTMLERHRAGLKLVEAWGHRKVAGVVQKEFINKHLENVANNRGGNVFTTHDYEEACNWLWN
jgi:hypothetical protein